MSDVAALLTEHQEDLTILMHSAVRRYSRRGLPPWLSHDDLKQQCWVAFGILAGRWQSERGVPFPAYVGTYLPAELARYVNREKAARRTTRGLLVVHSISHDTLIAAMADTVEGDGRYWDGAIYCKDLLATLDDQSRALVELIAGYGLSSREVGVLAGMGASLTHYYYTRALVKLRAAAVEPARDGAA